MAISDEHKRLISKLQPVDVPEEPCDECSPTVDGKNVEHSALCPVMLSVDSATVADRAWFEDHPYADRYYRPVTWGEAAQLVVMDEKVRVFSKEARLLPMGRVRVERISDDVRFRRFDDVYFVVDAITPRAQSNAAEQASDD